MPSPIGHSLAGYAIYSSVEARQNWRTIILFVLVAILPDIDFLPGFIVGSPNKYHHQFTHSLGFAVIVGLLSSGFLSIKGNKQFWRNFWIFSGLIFSHVVLDFFTLDTSVPYGEQLLWPFTTEYYLAPVWLFRDVDRVSSSDFFIKSLFIQHNLWTVVVECAVLLPVIGVIHILKKKHHD